MVKSGVFREKMQKIDVIFAFQLRQNSFSSIRHFLPPPMLSKKHRDIFINA